jgi:hypothetical protein
MRIATIASIIAVLTACGGKADDSSSPVSPSSSTPTTPAPPAGPRDPASVSVSVGADNLSASAFFGKLGGPSFATGQCAGVTWDKDAKESSADAGTIRVGVPGSSERLELTYDAASQLYVSTAASVSVASGTILHVTGVGSSEVPAFEGDILVGEAPQLTAPPAGTVIGDGEIAIGWKPVKDASLVVVVAVGSGQVVCNFDATTGRGVVPADLVRAAAATPTPCVGDCAYVNATFVRNSQVVTAGSYDVFLANTTSTTRVLDLKSK